MQEEDLSMNHQVNYRVHMHVRRMMSENKAARRRKQARKQQLEKASKAENAYDNAAFSHNENNASKVRIWPCLTKAAFFWKWLDDVNNAFLSSSPYSSSGRAVHFSINVVWAS